MRRLAALLLTAVLAAPGCAAVVSALPAVVAAVTDAALVVDSIERFVTRYFVAKPDPARQKDVEAALARARAALDVALRVAQGAEKLDQQQVDAAFAEFRLAYEELLVLVKPLGVSSGEALRATPGGLAVPEPMALKLRLR